MGAISCIQLVTLPCRSEESKKFEQEGNIHGAPLKFYDHKIIVTACSSGVIKSWKLLDPGVLNIVGCLRTGSRPHLTSMLSIGFLRETESCATSLFSPQSASKLISQKKPCLKSNDTISNKKDNKPVLYNYEKDARGAQDWVAPTSITAGVDFNIVCICGRSNGLLDTWVMSNEPGIHSKDGCPVTVNQFHRSPIVAIRQIPDLKCRNDTADELLCDEYSNCNVLCTSKDGWQSIIEANLIGEVGVVDQISVGASSFSGTDGVKDVIIAPVPFGSGENRYVDCIIVREEGISKYLLRSVSVPFDWSEVFQSYAELHGTGILTLRRHYSIDPTVPKFVKAESITLGSIQEDDETSVMSIRSAPVVVPSHLMSDSPAVSRPATGDRQIDFDESQNHATLSVTDGLLPIPDIAESFSPDGSRLVSSPSESRLDSFSQSALLQHRYDPSYVICCFEYL